MSALELFGAAILAAGCANNSPRPAPPVRDPIPMTETSMAKPVAANPILAAYERARALLAADKLAGLPDAAREIEAAAKAGTGAHYGAIAIAAAKLAASSDLDTARQAFGEVSKHVIAQLVEDPALRNGQHVFECPMVSGYKKWVQPSKDLQNPYMGPKMLVCGGESSWN